MADRREFKVEGSAFGGMAFDMQSTDEAQVWLRVFPWPIPEGWAVKYRVVKRPNGMESVQFYMEAIAGVGKAKPDAKPDDAPNPGQFVAELEKLSDADLETKCAEMGINPIPKRKVDRVSQIAKKMAENAKK